MDELLKRTESAIKSEAVKIGNANSLTGSNQSSHSPSVTGESLDVKVEITPAPPTPISDIIQTSYSIESTSSLTICSDTSSKSQGTSPHTRKFSEIPHDSGGFLNPIGNFNRINPSPPNTASARLFKKLEEMIDLSSPYNHYRCLSPSETNLSIPVGERSQIVNPNSLLLDSGKPGSSRLLRRQFSLDKDDLTMQKHVNLETISSMVDSAKHSNLAVKSPYNPLMSSASLPGSSGSNVLASKLHKHQSASIAQDLEKIEEIPISPINTSPSPLSSVNDQNSFKNSNSNNKVKTPPANLEESKEFSINIETLG